MCSLDEYGSNAIPGSLAAGIHSGIGSVVAGSPFAVLQSAAAGGYGAAIVNGVVQGGGVLTSLGGLVGLVGGGNGTTS